MIIPYYYFPNVYEVLISCSIYLIVCLFSYFMNTVQMQTKETYKANGANYILTSKFSSYVIDTIINWCVHEWRNYNNILHMFPNNLCCGYILYGSLLFQLTIWYDVSKVFWHIFFLFLTVFFRIRLIRSMISDTSRVEGRSCNQVFDIILFYIASLWKTHFLFVWSNLWVSHWSCKSWYRSGCRYSGFPRLKWIEKVSCIWFCN